jgi:hypothetical protein
MSTPIRRHYALIEPNIVVGFVARCCIFATIIRVRSAILLQLLVDLVPLSRIVSRFSWS